MGQRVDVPPLWTGEAIHFIKRLARERFIEQEIGSEEEFEQIWSDAFGLGKPLAATSSQA
jgi:hypothetical protein